jgi:2-polyprenyl-6-methoxyphenol hydroxylase-like FAD-dependent oxidoreductase
VRADDDIYLDADSQVHLPTWHKGRVALVGDAASSRPRCPAAAPRSP